MKEQEIAENYIRAFEYLLSLITDTDSAIDRAIQLNDSLGIRQYKHLKKDYVQQLAELIGCAPKSVSLQAVSHWFPAIRCQTI